MSGMYDRLESLMSVWHYLDNGRQNSPSLGAKVPESNGFLWWQVDHNKAIDPGLFRIF